MRGIDTLRASIGREDNFDIPHRTTDYKIAWVKGAENNPDIASRAKQIHGISYRDYGYFMGDAWEEDGSLKPELDGTREKPGLSVEISYLVGMPRDRELYEANATLRIMDIVEGGSIEDVPTYKYFKGRMSTQASTNVSERLRHLGGLVQQGRSIRVREIAALGSIGAAGRRGVYELMRTVIQSSIINKIKGGQSELYLTSLTDISLEPVLGFAGMNASEIIGDRVRIFTNDERAAPNLYVTPALVDPHKIIDGTVDEIEACVDLKRRSRLHSKLLFLTDGLTDEQMGNRAAAYINSPEAA